MVSRVSSRLIATAVLLVGAPAPAADPQPSGGAAAPAALATSSAAPAAADLQSPEQRDTRHTAYTLPAGMWGLDFGALGIGGGDVFARLGVAYGIGHGVQAEINLAHTGVGLLNVASHWHFIDTRYFDLGLGIGLWYGHGDWFWIAQGAAQDLVDQLDVINVPVALTASMPVLSALQLNLGVEYMYAELFGTFGRRERSLLEDANFGVRQLAVAPSVHWFIWHNTSLELSADLPLYTGVPVTASGESNERVEYHKAPFSETWSAEAALRSRLRPGVFGNVRLHYGEIARTLYNAKVYPSFELEVRL